MRLKSHVCKLALMVALTLFATAALAEQPTSFKEALAKAKAQNKMLVIDFYTDW